MSIVLLLLVTMVTMMLRLVLDVVEMVVILLLQVMYEPDDEVPRLVNEDEENPAVDQFEDEELRQSHPREVDWGQRKWFVIFFMFVVLSRLNGWTELVEICYRSDLLNQI